mmetsp:Transcript_23913/g.26660  ORF Transcript_23913/g.26660 Transcript_23913/m.26660 type:complete len:376 (-) Transcript_23913:166-1293(-)
MNVPKPRATIPPPTPSFAIIGKPSDCAAGFDTAIVPFPPVTFFPPFFLASAAAFAAALAAAAALALETTGAFFPFPFPPFLGVTCASSRSSLPPIKPDRKAAKPAPPAATTPNGAIAPKEGPPSLLLAAAAAATTGTSATFPFLSPFLGAAAAGGGEASPPFFVKAFSSAFLLAAFSIRCTRCVSVSGAVSSPFLGFFSFSKSLMPASGLSMGVLVVTCSSCVFFLEFFVLLIGSFPRSFTTGSLPSSFLVSFFLLSFFFSSFFFLSFNSTATSATKGSSFILLAVPFLIARSANFSALKSTFFSVCGAPRSISERSRSYSPDFLLFAASCVVMLVLPSTKVETEVREAYELLGGTENPSTTGWIVNPITTSSRE